MQKDENNRNSNDNEDKQTGETNTEANNWFKILMVCLKPHFKSKKLHLLNIS